MILGVISTFASSVDATSANFDTLSPGAYRVSTSDSPLGAGAGILYMLKRSDTYAQIYIATANYQTLKRYRSGHAGTWSDWKYIYDESMLTNQSLLSPLASALGGQLGVNVYSIEPSATDAPFPEGYTGIVFQYKGLAGAGGNVVLCEIAFKGSSTAQGSTVSEIKVRHKYANGPFTSWQKIALTT